MTFALTLLLLTSTAETSCPQGIDIEALRTQVDAVLTELDAPGASVGIVLDGQLEVHETFGYRNREKKWPTAQDTLYQVGSVSKVFAATLAVALESEGTLRLDESIGDYIDVSDTLRVITFEQLLTHTSGLPREPVNRRNLENSPSVMLPYHRSELLEGLSKTTLQAEPGRQFAYSNLGFAVLGHALEEAEGTPYEELLKQKLLTPLGMKDTSIRLSEGQEKRLAVHYWDGDADRKPRAPWVFGDVAAFSGLTSSVEDLARFMTLFLSPKASGAPLSSKALASLTTPRVEIPESGGRSVALGFFTEEIPGVGVALGHGGEVDGHSSGIAMVPSRRMGVIVLANLGGNTSERLLRATLPLCLAAQ